MLRRAAIASVISAILSAYGKSDATETQETTSSPPTKMGRIDKRLKELGIEIPDATIPIAAYTPIRKVGNMVYIAGQGANVQGTVGIDFTLEEGQAAARDTAIKVLSQLRLACDGDLNRVVQCVQLQGLVRCTPDFSEQHLIINGASELFRNVFGDAGLAARAAIGTNAFPRGAVCNLIATFEIA